MHNPAGFERTKRDVIRVVHIGATTLAKRVTEFAGTSASAYTFDDFEVRSDGIAGARLGAALLVSAARRRMFDDCNARPVNNARGGWRTKAIASFLVANRAACRPPDRVAVFMQPALSQ